MYLIDSFHEFNDTKRDHIGDKVFLKVVLPMKDVLRFVRKKKLIIHASLDHLISYIGPTFIVYRLALPPSLFTYTKEAIKSNMNL